MMQSTQMNPGMQGQVSNPMSHGGHEVFDVHEVLSGAIGALNMHLMLRQHAQDPELQDMMDRHYRFMTDEYNLLIECYRTGQKPSKRTEPYMMQQNNDFNYGIKPTQPKKPWQSPSELNDEAITGFMLDAHKSGAMMRVSAAAETTNPVVRRVIAATIPNCLEMAYEVSLYQNKHGYYQVPQLSQKDMQCMIGMYGPSPVQPQNV